VGYHYLPQYYLKGFVTSDNCLWSYEKGTGNKYCGNTERMANITNLYSPRMESYLANKIEGPANPVLDKIRRREQVTEEDKVVFAKYMSVMWKRVPAVRNQLNKMAPDLANKISNKLNEQLDEMACLRPSKLEVYKKEGKRQIRAILDRYVKSPPDSIWWKNIPPEKTPKVSAALDEMKWTFLTFDENSSFLTCDNPIFYNYARKPQAFKPGDEWHPFEAKPGGTWRSGANSDMIWLWPNIRLGPIRNTACSTTWCGYRNIVGGYCEAKWSSA